MTSTADMPQLLRLFFIQHKQVSIPGVGNFHLVRKPAAHDIASRKLLAPEYSIHFDPHNDSPSRDLFAYISRKKNISEWEAIGMVNEFSVELKEILRTGKRFQWDGIGMMETIPGGQVILKPADLHYDFLPDVHSNRVIRKEVAHTILVGETERSSGESKQWLGEDVVVAKAGWWIAAAIIAAIALIMIFYQFFRNDYSFVSGKQTPVAVATESAQHQDKTAQ